MAPLLEAQLDSIAIVSLIFARPPHRSKKYSTQSIDYVSILQSVCKQVVVTRNASALAEDIANAVGLSKSGQPGPVAVIIDPAFMSESVRSATSGMSASADAFDLGQEARQVASLIATSRCLIIAGRGCLTCSDDLIALAERMHAPVITTTSARGVIPENHQLSVVSDLADGNSVTNFIDEFDRVLALGVRFSENSTHGFIVEIGDEKLIQIDADANVLGANHNNLYEVQADVPAFLRALLETQIGQPAVDERLDLDLWRQRFVREQRSDLDPIVVDVESSTIEQFFANLRQGLPDDAILVTDSGMHQMLARRYFRSFRPSGLLVPTNFQSMGFGIAAAVGAKLGNPDREIVALIGDGGLRMSGLQLIASIANDVKITVVVFADGYFGLIRYQQIGYSGTESGVVLPPMDIEKFAAAIGVDYLRYGSDASATFSRALSASRSIIVEVTLKDSKSFKRRRIIGRTKNVVRRSPAYPAMLRIRKWMRRS
jgi:acetolactate synthase-1/2/3 large subunit